MKLQQLLQHRHAHLRHARLANVAFAYDELGRLSDRIVQAGLRGNVTLQPADLAEGRLWPVLASEEISPAVIEEHFLERDVLDLADLLAFVLNRPATESITFRLEELDRRFRPGLRRELEAAGIEWDQDPTAPAPAPQPESSESQPHER